MIGKTSNHGWSRPLEGRMRTAKVVDATEQENGVGNHWLGSGQVMSPTNQGRKISAKRTVETLNEGGVNRPAPLGGVAQAHQHGT